MIFSHPIPASITIALIIMVNACQQPTNTTTTLPSGPVAEADQSPIDKPLSTTTIELQPAAANKIRVDSYFSMYSFGPVQYFYHFENAAAALHVYISNKTEKLNPTAKLHLFAEKDAPHIDKWINNQHSDGIYADAPSPIESVDLSSQVSILKKTKLAPTSGRNGEKYDVYDVTLSLATWQRPPYILKEFEENTLVRVRISDDSGTTLQQ